MLSAKPATNARLFRAHHSTVTVARLNHHQLPGQVPEAAVSQQGMTHLMTTESGSAAVAWGSSSSSRRNSSPNTSGADRIADSISRTNCRKQDHQHRHT
jgi:hypothetical protein